MKANSRFARDAGLTLIELLVVLAMLGLLSGVLVTGIHTVAHGWSRVTQNNSDSEGRQATRRMLHQLLSQIYPARLSDGSQPIVQFIGRSDRMDFLAPLTQRFGTDDVVLYSLRSADGELRIAWRLDRAAPPGEEKFTRAVVEETIPDCRDGAFSYFGHAKGGGEIGWSDSWEERDVLPLLVRLRFVRGGRAEELVIAPLVTAGACAAGASNTTCRD
jgi:prepilin-type N-terminal cleavage/methylation domain-containing protein